MFYNTGKHDDINESSVCNIDIGGVHRASQKEANQNVYHHPKQFIKICQKRGLQGSMWLHNVHVEGFE